MVKIRASKPTYEQLSKRARGRRRYNLERQAAAEVRRQLVGALLDVTPKPKRKERDEWARSLGVSRRTVNRDIAELRLGARLDALFDKLFPARTLAEPDDWEWSVLVLADWPDAAAAWPEPKPSAHWPAHDRRGGARPGAGRKSKNRRAEFDSGLEDLIGAHPTARQLDIACQKLVERAQCGNVDAYCLIMDEVYGAP